jgi:glycyl-tRNA synthetase beta chain
MRHHQKYFSVLDEAGELAPLFLAVLNTTGDPDGTIRSGHEKVLQARLEDASFFWKTDRKTNLQERSESLDHVLFQEKLGTYRDKTERLRRLCAELDGDAELDLAAQLCKVDLTTEMVRELPELQGVIGGLYAREEGYPETVWRAIYEHYRPISSQEPVPKTTSGTLLSIADRLDTIVGCFGIDIIPTGSSDPFALRRQAQGLVSILRAHRLDFELSRLIELAQRSFSPAKSEEETHAQVMRFLEQRVHYLLQKDGIPYDILNATFAIGIGTVSDTCDRALALREIKGEEDFEALAAAYKRTKNILAGSVAELKPVESADLVEKEERELYQAYDRLRPRIEALLAKGEYLSALREMAGLRAVVDRFFDKVLVMAQDERLRSNRLALLGEISRLFLLIADISEIVQEGD